MKKVFGQRTDERMAALAGTRQMIAEDQFDALVAILVDCGAVPRSFMAGALRRLADRLHAKARGQIDCEYVVYEPELFARSRALIDRSARLT